MIILIAGKEGHQKTFTVHKKTLCDASPFFKAHCKPDWMKPDDKIIKLPEDNAEVVRMMIFWIYHNQICISEIKYDELNTWCTCEEALDSPWGLFTQLYVIAQKYQMAQLQNDVIDALLDLGAKWVLAPGIISWVYENTAKGDNLRKLIFRIAREDLTRSDLASFCDNLCQQFLFDMTYAAAQSDSHGKLEDNDKLCSIENPQEEFCAEYHHHDVGHDVGHGGKKCKKVKPFIEALNHE
jgi:hypothetical protein